MTINDSLRLPTAILSTVLSANPFLAASAVNSTKPTSRGASMDMSSISDTATHIMNNIKAIASSISASENCTDYTIMP